MTSANGAATDQEKLKQRLVQRFMESDNEDESVRSEKFFELLKWQRRLSGVSQESNSVQTTSPSVAVEDQARVERL